MLIRVGNIAFNDMYKLQFVGLNGARAFSPRDTRRIGALKKELNILTKYAYRRVYVVTFCTFFFDAPMRRVSRGLKARAPFSSTNCSLPT